MTSGEKYSHGYYKELVDALAQRTVTSEASFFLPALQPGMRVLDCGCGPGAMTIGLAERVGTGQVVGIDINAGQIALATQAAQSRGQANVSFQTGTVYELPFPDQSFDAVFAHTVLQHLAEPARALAEIFRVLKAPGVLGVREEDWGGTFWYPTSETLDRSIDAFLKDWRNTGGNPYLPRRYKELLRTAGFAEVAVSASAVPYTGAGAVGFSQMAAGLFASADFASRAAAARLADKAEIEGMRAAWVEWGRDATAFLSMTFCEAIAFKKP